MSSLDLERHEARQASGQRRQGFVSFVDFDSLAYHLQPLAYTKGESRSRARARTRAWSIMMTARAGQKRMDVEHS